MPDTPQINNESVDENSDLGDQDDSIIEPTADELDVIDFDQLKGDGTEAVTLQLFRTSPQFIGDIPVKGFLGNIELDGDADIYETVQQEFGGGKYVIRQRKGRHWSAQKAFQIGGPPRVTRLSCEAVTAENITEPTVESIAQPTTQQAGKPTMEIAGIQVNVGDIQALKEVALFKKMIDELFPPKQDMNEALLTALMKRDTPPAIPNPLEQVDTLASIFDKLQGFGGGNSGGGLLERLAPEAMRTVQALAARGNRTQPQPQPASPQTAQPIQQPPTPEQITIGAQPVNAPEAAPETAKEAGQMGQMQIAETAGQYITAGFIQEPQLEPLATKEMLDLVLPEMSKENRLNLKPHKSVLYNISNSMLLSQVETDATVIEEFRSYFDKVFELFTDDIDREPEQPSSESTSENEQDNRPPEARTGDEESS